MTRELDRIVAVADMMTSVRDAEPMSFRKVLEDLGISAEELQAMSTMEQAYVADRREMLETCGSVGKGVPSR